MLSGVNIGDNDERIVSESGSGQLILKSGPSKPKLESLNVSQWSMANLAILYKLLEEGHLVQNNILDYYHMPTPGGKEICKKFNSRLGCSLSGCKFEHVCNVPGCGQRHSGSGHQSSFPKNGLGPVKPLRDLHLDAWVTELKYDFDKEYLLHGIEFGFDIVTSAANELPSGIVGKNHPSASPNNPLYEKAHLQILNEIECGNYVFAEKNSPHNKSISSYT
ncbi:Hypothetical predicted protein [Mytilus galloprovincialis]|uniref:C3H1-type domain-containing protein n=1 Tax=Mytilus galloprovincialis TaxID=29158 RepID=A0A8B6FIR6_MYTGA|nr:Hypothetical predicted protein [Mytilus galloprovincialis]